MKNCMGCKHFLLYQDLEIGKCWLDKKGYHPVVYKSERCAKWQKEKEHPAIFVYEAH